MGKEKARFALGKTVHTIKYNHNELTIVFTDGTELEASIDPFNANPFLEATYNDMENGMMIPIPHGKMEKYDDS